MNNEVSRLFQSELPKARPTATRRLLDALQLATQTQTTDAVKAAAE